MTAQQWLRVLSAVLLVLAALSAAGVIPFAWLVVVLFAAAAYVASLV